ncbi:hypothetical protein [Ancylobacter sp. FA202]|uniref:hypothetical protein n=1 Tax=Ancylobacter sp. FA202 TaxID=1111106 RepID=UPI00037F5F0C|nr:hypothetical protein [Ancylobacter sp. FA202]
MLSRNTLRLALGLIALIAVIWFVSSFFVLEDENPRSSQGNPPHTITINAA